MNPNIDALLAELPRLETERLRLRKITPSILAQALSELDTDPSYAQAARALGERLHLEDGTGLAADIVEETIADYPGNYAQTESLLGAAS